MSASSFAGGLYENAWESTRLVDEAARTTGLSARKSAADLVWLILHHHHTFEPVRLGSHASFGGSPSFPLYIRHTLRIPDRISRYCPCCPSTPICAHRVPACSRPTPRSSGYPRWR